MVGNSSFIEWKFIKNIRIDSCTFKSNVNDALGIRARKIDLNTENTTNLVFTKHIDV